MARATVHRGSVTEFDDPAGLGVVRGDDGAEHRFHCTSLTDGTRAVPVGARVAYEVVPARDGRTEAVAVTPLAVSPSPPAAP